MILVKGPWDKTPGSSDLPFDVNHSMYFSGGYNRQGLPADVFFCMPVHVHVFYYCGLLAQEEAEGENWCIGWREPVL